MFIYEKELKILKENREYIDAIIDNFRELMESTDFSYRYKDLKIIYNNKNTILTIEFLGCDDKTFAIIKLGKYNCNKRIDTIKINKTENVNLAYYITHLAKTLSEVLIKLYNENKS